MTLSDGDSRRSPTSDLYVTPNTRIFAPLTGLPTLVQRLADPVDATYAGHLRVHVLRLLEDPELVAGVAAHLPREVRRDRAGCNGPRHPAPG